MRITKELEKRINEQINKSYEKPINDLCERQKELLERIRDVVSKEVVGLMNKSPILYTFIANQHYGDIDLDIIKESIFKRDSKDYEVPEMSLLKENELQIEKLKQEKKKKSEDLKIEIAYSKDLKSIKEVFASFNLEF